MLGLGICLSLLGQIGSNYGMLVQKKSVNEERTLGLKWWLGLILIVVFEIVTSAALFFAPASVISSLSSFSLIINAVLAPFVIPGEKLTWRLFIGCSCLLTACVCSVIAYPNVNSPRLSPRQLADLMGRPWIVTLLVLMAVLFIGMSIRYLLQHRKGLAPPLFALGTVAALSATSTTITTKAASTVIGESTPTLPILLILSTIILSLGSFGFTNLAFVYYEALSVVPIMNSLTQVMRIIVAGLVYNEFSQLTTVRAVLFFLCVSSVVIITFLLSLYTLIEKRDQSLLVADDQQSSLELPLTFDVEESVAECRLRDGVRMANALSVNFKHGLCPELKDVRITLIMPTSQNMILPSSICSTPSNQERNRDTGAQRRSSSVPRPPRAHGNNSSQFGLLNRSNSSSCANLRDTS